MDDDASLNDLSRFLRHGLDVLAEAVAKRDAPLRILSLASVGAEGAPEQRNVVLRSFEQGAMTLRLHSDVRAAKVAQMRHCPTVSLLGWDAEQHLQLRLGGEAVLHTDDQIADMAWASTHASERRTYAWTMAPGTAAEGPAPFPPDPDAGRENFCAVVVRLRRVELLELGRDQHRRARFRFNDDDPARPVEATWLIP